MTAAAPPFFWLHIKKAGGGSVRQRLAPHYGRAERTRRPVNFIQSDPALWNDILNNFRVPLGEYQFARARFARDVLWPDAWDDMVRFAFVREPVSRAVSMFHYLARPRGPNRGFVEWAAQAGRAVPDDTTGQFDLFLDLVAEARESASIYAPVDLHFTTHTAPVRGDVTDADGTPLLTLYRLEALEGALAEVFDRAGLPPPAPPQDPRPVNARKGEGHVPTPAQRHRIAALWPRDFDLYENALAPGGASGQ